MIDISELFSIVFYILLIVLVISLIILVINANKTLYKVDRLVDDLTEKSNQLDGVFSLIDGASDVVNNFGSSITSIFTSTAKKIFKRKKEKNNE